MVSGYQLSWKSNELTSAVLNCWVSPLIDSPILYGFLVGLGFLQEAKVSQDISLSTGRGLKG